MRSLRAGLLALVLGLLLLGVSASPAYAHASLVSVDPADGARLDESPAVVRLTFTERVSVGLGGVRVLDAEGDPVHDGAARSGGDVVEINLRSDLPDGTYVISYRVISADGHPVRGGSVFGVGDIEVDAAALGRVTGDTGDRTWEVIGAIGRGLAYAGVLLAAGGVAFLVLVHRGDAERTAHVRLIRVAAAVGGLASVVALPVQAALGTGHGAGSLFDDGVLSEVAKDGVGLGLGLAIVGLLLAVACIVRLPALAVAGAALAAASFATNGHTRAGSIATLATVVDVTHLWVTAVWGGGLVLLWHTLRARRGDSDHAVTASIVVRFSTLATVTVLLVGVTGSVLAWNEIRTLDGLTGTTYGRLLLAKVAIVALIAALGAHNDFRLVPALTRGQAGAALGQLWTTVRIEVLAVAGVIVLTAVLVVVTPARTGAESGVVERVVQLGDVGSVQLTVAPAHAGFNQIHLYLFDADGRPADIAETVTLELSLPAADLGPISREAVRAGPAHLQLDGNDLAVGGTWTIEIHARIDRFTEVTGTTEIPVTGHHDHHVHPGTQSS